MSKQIEALKLALGALELGDDASLAERDTAITALREALAEQPAQQEPVAVVDLRNANYVRWLEGVAYPVEGSPLYTTPQAQPAREPLTKACDTCINCQKSETGLHSFNADVCRQCCHYFDNKYEGQNK